MDTESRSVWYSRPEWWLVIFTLILGVVTAHIFYNQLGATQRQAEDIKQQTHDIERQIELDQRPFVEIWAPRVPPPHILEYKHIVWTVYLRAVGKPARDVHMTAVSEIIPAESSPALLGTLSHLSPLADFGIRFPDYPKEPVPVPSLLPITHTDLDNLADGKAYVVVLGVVKYRDTVNKEHWTHFCNYFSPKNDAVFAAQSCVEFNNVDDN